MLSFFFGNPCEKKLFVVGEKLQIQLWIAPTYLG
jgi:hypothetical protein